MKPIIPLFAFVLLLCSSLHAQTGRGTILVGGMPGFGLSQNAQTLYLDPQVGYFLLDHWVVGTRLDVRFSRQRIPIFNVLDNSWEFSVQADPFLFSRYYFSPSKKWRPFAHAEAGYLGEDIFTGAVGGGIAYFINQHFGLDLAVLLDGITDGRELQLQGRGLEFGLNFFLNTRKQE